MKKSIIPKKAKKVFKGELFEVYQWKQKMFDKTTETFEALRRQDTAVIIATKNNKIIIADEKQPGRKKFLTLITGRIEKGEKPLQAAKRELKEESAMTSKEWTKIGEYQPSHKIDWKTHIYIAKNCEKKGEQQLDNGEKISIKEITLKKLIDLTAKRKIRNTEIAPILLESMTNKKKYHELEKKLF